MTLRTLETIAESIKGDLVCSSLTSVQATMHILDRLTITGGNFHYANNDSLNTGAGLIVSRGGAIGVDTGVANNSTFAGKIDPVSFGGLMLAPSDAAANLDFTSTLANAAGMTVAAPEMGMTFTGIYHASECNLRFGRRLWNANAAERAAYRREFC